MGIISFHICYDCGCTEVPNKQRISIGDPESDKGFHIHKECNRCHGIDIAILPTKEFLINLQVSHIDKTGKWHKEVLTEGQRIDRNKLIMLDNL